jgi:phosphate transport system permease protein
MTTISAEVHAATHGTLSVGRPRSRRALRLREVAVNATLTGCATFSILTTTAIVFVLATETIRFFATPDVTVLEFVAGTKWSPLLGAEKHFGIWPLIIGTLVVTVIAMLVALPLGFLTAIFLSEYASPRLRACLKPVLEVLAGIPTIVYGFFALTVITPLLRLEFLASPPHTPFDTSNALSAGIAVGIMCLPIVCSLTEDALRAVPISLREGAYALGGTKLDTTLKVVFPAALSGVIAATLLAVARAVGETMIVALAAGNLAPSFGSVKELASAVNPAHQTQTMTTYMVQIFLGDASNFGPEYFSSYAVAATLFLMTLTLTLIGHRVRLRFREAYE